MADDELVARVIAVAKKHKNVPAPHRAIERALSHIKAGTLDVTRYKNGKPCLRAVNELAHKLESNSSMASAA